jgi:hypothetical protein
MRGGRGSRTFVALTCVLAAGLASTSHADGAIVFEQEDYDSFDGQQNSGTLQCDGSDDAAIGAGFDPGAFMDGNGQTVDQAYLHALEPADFSPGPPGWRAITDNYAAGAPENTSTLALFCDTNPRSGQYRLRQSGNISIPDGSELGVTARCKKEEIVVGGGLSNGATLDNEAIANSSGPIDGGDRKRKPDDGWRAEVNNDDTGGTVSNVVAYAVCDRKRSPRRVKYRSRTVSVPNDAYRTVVAPCKDDETTLGGGVRSHSRFADGLYVSRSTAFQGWSGRVHNFPTPDSIASRDMTVTAICL